MSNIPLIKYLTYTRILFWYFLCLICLITRTIFIVQTWSKTFIFILLLNIIFSIINLIIYNHRYYQKTKRILIIILPLLSISTLIVYILYLTSIYYRIMDLVTLNIMANDRNKNLLSITLNYYQCCRIQEEILFDSVNERDYFLLFPYCEKVILDNEMKKDHWDNITTCGSLFRSIVFYIRFVFILDLLLNFILTIASLVYIWEEIDQWIDDKQFTVLITNNVNYKKK